MATGLIVGAVVGALAGAAGSAYSAHEQRKAARQQASLQREANEREEQIAKAQAGVTPQERQAQASAARKEKIRSGLRQSILTNQSSNGTKLGD